MKKFYYFSKHHLKFVEIKNYKLKMLAGAVAVFVFASAVIFTGITVYNAVFDKSADIVELRKENQFLKSKIKESASIYGTLNSKLDSLRNSNRELRVAANLPPQDEQATNLNTGGSGFNNLLGFLASGNDEQIKNSLGFIEQVKNKFNAELEHSATIRDAFANNQKLYKSIPAIKPCSGTLAEHGFGMRLHPILGIVRMHNGLDILTDVGTEVFAPGDGVVVFSGEKGGFGNVVEIDHGFGYRTIYGHLSASKVKEGQRVTRGMLIAKTGNTGLSSGPHLHYEVLHNGVNLDPQGFFFDDTDLFNSQMANN